MALVAGSPTWPGPCRKTSGSRRGCHSAWIDTFNPAARRAYERQGYVPFGELPDFPKGRNRVFLKKALSPA
ncbi:hypothetical protein SFHH103_02207 [Sinorhizobium fredii HH103]|uniref:N-acetyltransferase domain-containing protein n=1 Tax=Sinorhizobium fredii (strain HH103) TaxID=1117943 RepID=G9A8X2_SINF1|nr:Acetyltransferase [Sinorhizobium fredii CCBAU 83666]GEC33832.1 hypothetical protein EFR01_40030 [Sinorhizobium fredii]GLS06698.1 hypothetical protein GCM10007864_03230 [Sinorhizobium fredii]CCE96702.1 hypothetical protein SFHH103_02207 [Sinorhizobium fredii HH103]